MAGSRSLRIFLFALLSCLGGELFAQVPVVEEGQDWRFFRGVQEPPENWKAVDFDDGAWEVGPTGIGYGDEDDATVLADMQGSYLTVYLRRKIVVPLELYGSRWRLSVRYDDGFVAYVDGQEVMRRQVDGEPPAFDQPASGQHDISGPTGFDESALVPDGINLLAPGEHVIAVQVHNVNLESSDLSFSLELEAAPFYLTEVAPGRLASSDGEVVSVFGLGFMEGEPVTVTFSGEESPGVEVISREELRVELPAGLAPGAHDVIVETARGTAELPAGFRIATSTESGLGFSGDNDAPDAATLGDLAGILEEGTVELFFARQDEGFLNFRWRSLLSLEAAGGGDALTVEIQGEAIRIRLFSGGEESAVIQAPVALGDSWHHAALSITEGALSLIVDGIQVAGSTEFVDLFEVRGLRLGANYGGGYGLFLGPFLGRIESARLWDFARTPAEVAREAFDVRAARGALAAWDLGEGSGQVARTSDGSGLDLVLGDSAGEDALDPAWTALGDFPRLVVSAVTPPTGPSTGGTSLRVFGTGFDLANLEVTLGDRAATIEEVVSAHEIVILTPELSGFGPVDLTARAGGLVFTRPEAFTAVPEGFRVAVEEGAIWHYFEGIVAPPADWASVDFDADLAGWASGPTGLGYGDGDDATEVNIQGRAVSLFARHDFEFEGLSDLIELLVLRVRFDDGFVAYLNGEEVARQGVAGVPPAFDALAEDHEITGGAGSFDIEIDLLAEGFTLLEGTNTLAVEVHNGTLESSDLSLSAELLLAGPEGRGRPFVRGDLDDNGRISITDVVRGLLVIFGDLQLTCTEAADVQDDGRINIQDPIHLLDYLFHNGPDPLPPFPLPGRDRDEDEQSCPEVPSTSGV